ncbi:TIGR02594 family protein [Pseudooceanicola aestuarii]|uniref:TIGR02594 family protein n=1 Tax=Pseudooceanicola aestuarii TaxID=2697319 RepID=UPI0013CF971A|nr:TIGR02594 family protein [Pseudooceanicola aestuarii]
MFDFPQRSAPDIGAPPVAAAKSGPTSAELSTDGTRAEAPRTDLPWIEEALRLYQEDGEPGVLSRRRVLHLMHTIGDRLPSTLPWCGLFVGHCMRRVVADDAIPEIEPRARPWCDFGMPVRPQYGAILVFWRLFPRSPFGHVAFCVGESRDHYLMLGGNQQAQMRLKLYPKHRLLTARWPLTGPDPAAKDTSRQ